MRLNRRSPSWSGLLSAVAMFMACQSLSQTLTSLRSFGTPPAVVGWYPCSQLVQAPDGTLYGTTSGGEGYVSGTVFRMRSDGSGLTFLKVWITDFVEVESPSGGLTLLGNVLYGTTYISGSSRYGTLYKLNTDGSGYTVLKRFTPSEGTYPAVTLAPSGNEFYGKTSWGGASGHGTLFKVNLDGTGYTVLKHFEGND